MSIFVFIPGAGDTPWTWPEFMRRVVRERLAIAPDEMDGGHMVALSRPRELAERLDAYAAEAGSAVPLPAARGTK